MNRITLLYLALFVVLSACSTEKETTQSDNSIPALLDRNEKIRNGVEWDHIQNLYANSVFQINNNKKVADAYIRLSEVFINEARVTGEHGHYYPGALEVIEKGLDSKDLTKDQNFRLLTYKASVMLSQHEFQEALEIGKKALALNKYNAQIYGVLVDAYVELGDYKNAVMMADKMVNIRPDLRSYSRVSYLREIHGNIPGAIEALQLAIAAGSPGDEQTAWAGLTLGSLYEKMNDLDAAQYEYERILSERKNYPFAIAAIANIDYQKGQLDKAEMLLNTAIEIIPEVGFYEQLAHIYQDQNREEEFNEISKEILLMLEDDVVHGHNMNMEYTQLYLGLFNDHKKALQYIEKEYTERPENIDVNKLMALIYHELGEEEQSKFHVEKSLKTGADFPEINKITAQYSYK